MASQVYASLITTGLPADLDAVYYEKPENDRIVVEEYVPEATIVYDLSYCGENSTKYQKLHLVLPQTTDEKKPVIIEIHGGVWSSGNSEEDHRVHVADLAGLHFLEDGYAVALVDYSVKNKENPSALPNQIYEIKAAIRFIRSIADEYGLDAERIALLGESAGGHLADIVGATNGESAYDLEDYGNMEFSSEVQAVIGQYSLGDLKSEADNMLTRLFGEDVTEMDPEVKKERIQFVSAIYHVDETDPPFYLEHGLSDGTVSYAQSCDLYNALIAAGNERSELHLYPGMDHGVNWFQSQENSLGYRTWLNAIFGVTK